ncbi:MAG: 1,4-dihydroxy-2-naphthoate polyprenyltransferase [Actinomycetaceae bacterium]|nr:1,4-dihydroxy-2-naphthoate polyprenyltransferase [Actinomycetaceae bacterium]
MASFNDWLEGARLRTLPAAAAPVLIGIGGAHFLGEFSAVRSVLAMAVALLLQIGVNFSNDYSDGIRGTDKHRTGPPRLTGGGKASPKVVLYAALGCFAVAGVLGLTLIAISGTWLLLIPGALAVLAAWFYTGGRSPYGYMGVGLSELFVFVFFGLMATVATTWVQAYSAPWWLWVAATGTGVLSVSLLFVNNIRDIPTDSVTGKRTLPVRLGDHASRITYTALVGIGTLLTGLSLAQTSYMLPYLIVFVAPMFLIPRPVLRGAEGKQLLGVLRNTGLLTLFTGLFVCVALVVS